jgi:hypothetical protein
VLREDAGLAADVAVLLAEMTADMIRRMPMPPVP